MDRRLVPPFRVREKRDRDIEPAAWPKIIEQRWAEAGHVVRVWKLPSFGAVDVRADLIAGLPRSMYLKLTEHRAMEGLLEKR